jgi:hypothetical protein
MFTFSVLAVDVAIAVFFFYLGAHGLPWIIAKFQGK